MPDHGFSCIPKLTSDDNERDRIALMRYLALVRPTIILAAASMNIVAMLLKSKEEACSRVALPSSHPATNARQWW